MTKKTLPITPETIDTAQHRPIDDLLIDEKELAKRWSITPRMLQSHRVSGKLGLPHIRLGSRLVRYRLSDVLAFEAANARHSTSDGWKGN